MNAIYAQYSRVSLVPKLSTKKKRRGRAKSKTRSTKKVPNSIGEVEEDIEKYRYERIWDSRRGSGGAYYYLDRKMGVSSWTAPADLNETFFSWRDTVSIFFLFLIVTMVIKNVY